MRIGGLIIKATAILLKPKERKQLSREGTKLKLKSISKDTIPAALERADRYRKINEPNDAASICYDILNADPGNQKALITLLLALSEQFVKRLYPTYTKAISILSQIADSTFALKANPPGSPCDVSGK